MSYRLGLNLGFAVNRFIEPEEWARIASEKIGVKYVQFVADLLNPFLPKEYVDGQVRRINDSVNRYGLQIESVFTSAFTRVNHLMHPDEQARKIWLDWFKKLLDIGAAFGARNAGSHFGILTVKSNETQGRREFLIEEGVKSWQRLSFYAKELGYRELIFEPMSIPREMGWTIKETKELLDRINANSGVVMKVCLDVGHAPHQDERDPYEWIKALASVSPVIHLQQTQLNKSNHWPFTKEYNAIGIIEGKRVVESARAAGCEDTLFALEISHREHWDTDHQVVPDLKESVAYWRQYIDA
ncbi:MAG: sugar phosphate isomerase/epimerase [Oscillospiraceae bacterium]|nr:sugar phosphate isomerase/epimerase [Oscillospiraceae bacterium]